MACKGSPPSRAMWPRLLQARGGPRCGVGHAHSQGRPPKNRTEVEGGANAFASPVRDLTSENGCRKGQVDLQAPLGSSPRRKGWVDPKLNTEGVQRTPNLRASPSVVRASGKVWRQ